MDIYTFFTELVFAFLEGLAILLVYLFFMDKKNHISSNKLKTIIYLLLYTCISYVATLYTPPGLQTIFYAIFLVSCLTLITRSNIYASFISMCISFIFILFTELLVMPVIILTYHTDFNTVVTTPELRFITGLFVRIIQFVSLAIIFRFRLNIFKQNVFKKENTTLAYAIVQITIISTILISANYMQSSKANIGLYNVFVFSLILILIIFNFIDYKEREKTLRLQHKHQLQDEYVKNLETMLSVVRREKHDFTNHLNTLFALSVAKTPDSLEKIEAYIRKLTENYQTPFQFYNTGNDYINGLLAMKSSMAVENGIDLEVSIDQPLSDLKVDDSDLTSIIGNIVDNAFEAVRSNPEGKRKSVCLWTYVQDSKFCISVSNTGPVIESKNLAKIFEQGFSTKSNDRREHGYGLYITRQLITRNGGTISVTSTEDETEFIMEFGA